MKHTDPKLFTTSTFDARTSRILTSFVVGIAFSIAIIGLGKEFSYAENLPARVIDSFSLYGGHQNLTSWYQALMLGISALFWLIWASQNSGNSRSGLTLGAAVLLYMSVGEHTNFDHEFSMRLVSNFVPPEHAHSASMGAASLVAAGLFMVFSSTVRKCHKYATMLAIAFFVYVVGAIGGEIVSGSIYRAQGASIFHHVSTSAEELLETFGTMLFGVAMIKQLSVDQG